MVEIVINPNPVYIDITAPQGNTIELTRGAVQSVNGQTGNVLVNAVPDGGTTGQVLAKNSNTDNDTEWITVSTGGGQVDTVAGTANRITVNSSDPENPIVNIDSAYDTAILDAISLAVGAKKVYVNWRHQYGGTGAVNPLDSQHYYFAHPNIAVTNTVGDTTTHAREVAAPVTGTIVAAIINFYIGNAGSVSSEAGTLKFRNTTAATLTTLSSAVTWNTSVVDKAVVVTGLSLAVTRGDMCMTLLGTPAWATNPTGSYFSVDYIIELP